MVINDAEKIREEERERGENTEVNTYIAHTMYETEHQALYSCNLMLQHCILLRNIVKYFGNIRYLPIHANKANFEFN